MRLGRHGPCVGTTLAHTVTRRQPSLSLTCRYSNSVTELLCFGEVSTQRFGIIRGLRFASFFDTLRRPMYIPLCRCALAAAWRRPWSTNRRTQFRSHGSFLDWWALLALCWRSSGVYAPGTLVVGRPARQPPSDRPMQASPVRKRRNAVFKALLIRRLVRPTGAALAVIGRASSLGVTVIIPHTPEHQNGPGLSAVIRGTT